MSYNVYAGNEKALVFPTMCDAHILVEYTKHNQSQNIGLWANMKSFTCQFLVTPYDVNGYGDNTTQATLVDTANGGVGRVDSKKTMPASADAMSSVANQQDQKYLATQYRYTHEMCLLHNTNVTVSLANKTTYNQNQPAEYSIKFKLTVGGDAVTLESPIVFRSRNTHYGDMALVSAVPSDPASPSGAQTSIYSDWPERFVYRNNTVVGEIIGGDKYSAVNITDKSGYKLGASPTKPFTSSDVALLTIATLGANQPALAKAIHVGMTLLDSSGLEIGTVVSLNGTYEGVSVSTMQLAVRLSDGYDITTITTNEKLYQPPKKEALYLLIPAHIAVSYDDNIKRMSIFYNGIEVANGVHTNTGKFSLEDSDIYIGKNASLTFPADRKTQFMGELHELSISTGYQKQFGSTNNILTPYKDTLLYYNFSEGED
jgi:hypothetical protein